MKASLPTPTHYRIVWIDYAKTAAIFLVVLLHTHCTPWISKSINLMIMPCFFILSGYLFSYSNNDDPRRFAIKRFRQLVVPYLWINIVAWAAWATVLRHYGDNTSDSLAWHLPLLGAFCGVPPLLAHDIPLWSLLSFFVTEMLFYPLRHGKHKMPYFLIIICSWGVAWFLSEYLGSRMAWLPMTLGPSLCALGFYALGNWWRSREELTRGRHSRLTLPVMLCAIIIAIAAWVYNTEVEFYICVYGHFPLFVLGSIAGSIILIFMAQCVAHLCGEKRFVRLVSVGTLLICGFHLLIFALIKGVMLFGFGIQPNQLTEGVLRGVIFAIAAFVLTLPIIIIIRRYFRFLVDK